MTLATYFSIVPTRPDYLGRSWAVEISHLDEKGVSCGRNTVRFRTLDDAKRYVMVLNGASPDGSAEGEIA